MYSGNRGGRGGGTAANRGGREMSSLKRKISDYINGETTIMPNIEKLSKQRKPSTFDLET